jgi:hypothetical protein
MDDTKKKILVGYLIAIALSILIVPWKMDFQTERYKAKISEGYGFILSPPNEPVSSIDSSRIFVEFVLITAAAGIIYTLRDKIFKQSAQAKSFDPKEKKPVYLKVGTGDNVTWALDNKGNASGTVTKDSDGKTVIGLGPGADYTTLLTSSFIMFSNNLNDEEKEILVDWGVVPIGPWTAKQREKFALALMHHFHDLKESGAVVPEEFKKILELLPSNTLPPLNRPLTNEVRRLFNGLFAGLGRIRQNGIKYRYRPVGSRLGSGLARDRDQPLIRSHYTCEVICLKHFGFLPIYLPGNSLSQRARFTQMIGSAPILIGPMLSML